MALLVIATISTLLAGILQTICMVKHTERYLMPSRILTLCASIFCVASIFYYYDHVFQRALRHPVWSQHIAGFVAGITTGLSIYQMTNAIYDTIENRKST
nr:hypothetical transcript [Hymenolepis microstoma]